MVTLARVGVETSKEVEASKKVFDAVIHKFFKGYLGLRTNEEIHQKAKLATGHKPFMAKLISYYSMNDDDYDHHDIDSEREEEKTPFQIMREKQREMENMKPATLTIDSMIRTLET